MPQKPFPASPDPGAVGLPQLFNSSSPLCQQQTPTRPRPHAASSPPQAGPPVPFPQWETAAKHVFIAWKTVRLWNGRLKKPSPPSACSSSAFRLRWHTLSLGAFAGFWNLLSWSMTLVFISWANPARATP